MKDLYEILGVKDYDDLDTIKKAYKALVKKYHPDRNMGDPEAMERIKEINMAYSIISNAYRRELYDKYGEDSLDPNFKYYDDEPKVNVFHPVKGRNINQTVNISLEDSAFGCAKIITINKMDKCPTCNGTGSQTNVQQCDNCLGTGEIRFRKKTISGYKTDLKDCPVCDGYGFVSGRDCTQCSGVGYLNASKKIPIKIPAGIKTGRQMRFTGGGEPGKRGGEKGDLVLHINVLPHEYFVRDGDDILLDWHISLSDALLGATIQIPTLYGEVPYTVAEGTQHLTKFKIKNKGVPHLKLPGKGCQYVTLHIDLPKRLTEEQKKHIQACNFTKN